MQTPVAEESTVHEFNPADFFFLPEFSAVLDAVAAANVQDAMKQAAALKAKLQRAVDIVEQLPGVGLSRQQQKDVIDQHSASLSRKRELLARYSHLAVFDGLERPLPLSDAPGEAAPMVLDS